MPRQFGKVDISATWACPRCPYKHAPLAACPKPGVWLLLTLCPQCNATTGLYCRTHRDRHMPALQVVDIPAPPGEQGEYRRRIGEEGAA